MVNDTDLAKLLLSIGAININVKNEIIKSPTATNWGSTANISK